jgi:hypothetical protein
MKGRVKIVVIGLWVSQTCFASNNTSLVEAGDAAMGFVTSPVASVVNPGGISLQNESNVSLHYENDYGVKELSQVTAVGVWKNGAVDAGAVISNFGYDKYGETRFAGQLSKRLSASSSLGIRVNYFSYNISADEGHKSVLSVDVGLLVSPVEKIRMGIVVDNLIGTSYKTQRDEYSLPLTMRFGVMYQAAKDLKLESEVEKNTEEAAVFKIGCEYLPIKEIPLRIGLIGQPYRPTFGIGYRISHFAFDLASVYHIVLGFHTLFSMQYKF